MPSLKSSYNLNYIPHINRIELIYQETRNYRCVRNEYGLYDIIPMFTAQSIHHTRTHYILNNLSNETTIPLPDIWSDESQHVPINENSAMGQFFTHLFRTAMQQSFPIGIGHVNTQFGLHIVAIESPEEYVEFMIRQFIV